MDKFEAIIDDLKNNRQPQICNCYHVTKELRYLSDFEKGYYLAHGIIKNSEEREVAKCFGTKECETCTCDGNMCECDFYEDVRKKAKAAHAKACAKGKKARMEKLHRNDEHDELMFYRQWILDHDLQFELLADWNKWKQDHNSK